MYKNRKQNNTKCGAVKLIQARLWQAVLALVFLLVTNGQAIAENVRLNFKGADIQAVITSVADITGKNFIVDPRVKGKVTIISSRAMNAKEIYQVFLTVLDVHGYAAIPSGNVIKILPDADAKHSGVPALDKDEKTLGDESVTQVLEVQHIAAAQLVPILRPLVPPQGHLAAFPQSNILIISDRARNIERLVKIIQRIDQPASGEIEIIRLEYAAASDLVRVLTTLQQQEQKGQAPAENPTLVADERTNSILIGGDRSDRLQLRAIISHLDTPAEVEGDTHVVYLKYANAKDLVPVLTGVGESTKNLAVAAEPGKAAPAPPPAAVRRSAGGNQPLFDIQADENANALVITAPPSIFRSLEAVIRQLDIRRAQVQVEAVIAEISSQRTSELGIQWIFDGSQGNKPVGVINFGNNPISALAAAISSSVTSISDPFGPGMTVGVGRFDSDTFNFAAVIRALEGDGATNVLSTPTLVTMDNEEAEIFIGQEVSIPSGSFTVSGSTATNPFTTFERVPVGIKLKVKPQINEGNTVRLNIEQNVDSFAAGTAGQGDIVTNQRTISTTVVVDDGKVLVLGGLIKDDLLENSQKVPLLGDIPLLGALFRSKSVQKIKTNLLIFLRPLILRDEASAMALTNSKYKYIRDLQVEKRKEGVPLLSDELTPMLEEMENYLELPPAFKEPRKQGESQLDYEIKQERSEDLVEPPER
ncbi:MAG TPA: type II secretion system secretin GspD [Gammaproteobacteria bacterium]